jgi:hypothetical protein
MSLHLLHSSSKSQPEFMPQETSETPAHHVFSGIRTTTAMVPEYQGAY